ncbi:unnamed protein product, partial [marine sediment metagenome]
QIIEKIDFKVDYKNKTLAVAITQCESTNQVLMVAYMDSNAFKKTLTTGFMHYYSRSRDKIWLKGETSGNIQKVSEIFVDCDGDAILFKVDQLKEDEKGDEYTFESPSTNQIKSIRLKSGGVACHTKKRSCFFKKITEKGEIEEK